MCVSPPLTMLEDKILLYMLVGKKVILLFFYILRMYLQQQAKNT